METIRHEPFFKGQEATEGKFMEPYVVPSLMYRATMEVVSVPERVTASIVKAAFVRLIK
jgi:hypothetical protein